MIENQAYLFLVFSLTGILIGILFDIFRVLRKTFKTIDIITYFEDILFWILTGIIILYNIWYFNDGEIRIYMFLGIILGVLIYLLTLSNIIIKIISSIINGLKKFLKIFLNPIISIFRKICKISLKIVEKMKKVIKFANQRRKIEKNGE